MSCSECGASGKKHLDGCPAIEGEKTKKGGHRSEKAKAGGDSSEHRHDYRLTRETVDIVRDRSKVWSVRTKTFSCINRKGKCSAPVHLDVTRVRL